ncbi:MAG TPA: protein kinase [Vicinamibacterales bacterium]|nr:protein kinase [Vicinamibacterales bacterium]
MIGTTIQHYKIARRLGAGGMGEVYLAEDVRLGRPVALKFLPEAVRLDPASRGRLLNEARAASLLRSPNIAVTYDIGEDEGADFIVMEYVEGELLSERVAKGPLALREVIDIGLQVTDALDEAHGRGITHRDIKTANLMRTERGLVKVLDFGLAKFEAARNRDASVTATQVTIPGLVVGTIAYMAPEQALGRPVDHRVDLFSLGVVLYELATGRPPFAGASPTEIIDHILHETPPQPSALNTRVPTALDAIIARALEKSPTFRYQTAREMQQDLRELATQIDEPSRTAGSRGILAVAAQQTAPIGRSVAVMTFANITREAADDWIGTGIAETVSSDLKNISGLTVIGRARVYDALRHLGSHASVDDTLAIDIGRRLGATWVVVGGFQKIGELVRITANFLDIGTGTIRRTVKVDGRVADIFALQDKIVYELSQGLNVVLRGTEIAGIEKRETKSVEAYESFARGMMNLRLATRDSIERAIALFEHATEHDPEYALAWAALGGAYGLKGSFLSVDTLVEKAVDIERRALTIDPELADAHAYLGAALLSLGRVDEAVSATRDAIRLEPDNGQAHQALGRALWIGTGDFAAAIPEFERAIALNPEAGYSYLQLGLLLAWEGQYQRAEEVCRRAVELQDQYISGNAGLQVVGANARLGYVYYLQGRYDEAIAEYERGLSFVASSDHALKDRTAVEINVKMGAAYQHQGRTDDANRHFARAIKGFDSLIAKGADDPFTRYYIAIAHALTGAFDRAFDSLQRVAAKLPASTIARMRRDRDLDALRDDARFDALMSLATVTASPTT